MRAISGAKITPTSVSRPSPTTAMPSSPLASRSASSSSPRSSNVTNDGTSTADSAGRDQLEQHVGHGVGRLDALPRKVVPNTAATTNAHETERAAR
jgi:hypothetical protein